MQTTAIVLGLGFGDEGKGLTTAYLASQRTKSLVVRFSGGHQAGHTVVDEQERRHVFSHFGSGTLHGVPTFWSKYCTFNPTGLIKEYESLKEAGCVPTLFIDNMSPVTTPYDIVFNRAIEAIRNRHGSCGVGFGTTIQRSDETPHKLYAQDILFPVVFRQRLRSIANYYQGKVDHTNDTELQHFYRSELQGFDFEQWFQAIEKSKDIITLTTEHEIFSEFEHIVFEGSQGILLDMDHGFFPHVTRANTVSKNAMEIIQRNRLASPHIYYVTRAYQTRHGNGPMTNEGKTDHVLENPLETNQTNQWQGAFRKGMLDIDLINYALLSDKNYTPRETKSLVMTCLDQIHGDIAVSKGQEALHFANLQELILSQVINAVGFESYFESHSDQSHLLKKVEI